MKNNKTQEYTFEEEQLHNMRLQDSNYVRRLKQSHSQGFQEGEVSGIKRGLLKAVEVAPPHDIPRMGSENQEIYRAYSNGYNDAVAKYKRKLEALIKEGEE